MEAGFAMDLKECHVRHRRLMYRALNEVLAATRALSDRAIEFPGRRTANGEPVISASYLKAAKNTEKGFKKPL